MSDEEAPKSAYELAMERLRRKDRDAGVEERVVTEEQRSAIAELRRVHEAKLAELEIMHRQALLRCRDLDEQAALEETYRRERERVAADRDAKIEAARR